MRQGPYELQIIGSSGAAYAEEDCDGKKYIRAREGEQYKVKVTMHEDALGHFPFSRAKVFMRLDGVELSYVKRLEVHNRKWAMFRGFRKDKDTLRSFVFSSPSVHTPSANTPSSTKMGTIEVSFFKAGVTSKVKVFGNGFDKGQDLNVQEDKKFWQQASLGTVRGNELRRQLDNTPRNKWKRLRTDPDATLVLHYHTPEMIDFLKSMHQKVASSAGLVPAGPPVHIDLSTQRDESPVVTTPTSKPAHVIDLMQDAPVRVKRENTGSGAGEGSAQKRSRSSSSSGQMSTQIVDLT